VSATGQESEKNIWYNLFFIADLLICFFCFCHPGAKAGAETGGAKKKEVTEIQQAHMNGSQLQPATSVKSKKFFLIHFFTVLFTD